MKSPSSMPRSPRRRRRQVQGFSLLEVMISASLFLLAVAGTLSAFSTIANHRVHQKHMVQALHIAETHVEESLVRLSSDAVLQPGTVTTGLAHYNKDGSRTGAASFFRVDMSSAAHAAVSDVVVVQITVVWQENGVTHSFQLRTERA